jgi:hypothetical protein
MVRPGDAKHRPETREDALLTMRNTGNSTPQNMQTRRGDLSLALSRCG